MRLKVISGIMLALFLVNMLSMVGSVSATIPPSKGNLNGDNAVDIFDVVIWAHAFGSRPGDPNWNSTADIVADLVIDIYDGVVVGNNFGLVDP